MLPRAAVPLLAFAAIACTACGGGAPRTNNADILAANQPTPDPTLDAVVRDLPRALAGVAPTATPTPLPITPKPQLRQAPAEKPAAPSRKPTATPIRR
jgi:hypothetical protein